VAYDVRPVTADRWPDLLDLFGPNGGYANCWCMWWRVPNREFEGRRNRAALDRLVAKSLFCLPTTKAAQSAGCRWHDHGALITEGYPVDTGAEHLTPAELYTGTLDMFRRAGFTEVQGRTGRRRLVRRSV
jgi:hypothetical protein